MIVLLFAIVFTLTGCWDSTETEQLGMVTLIGVGSGNDNDIRVVIQEKFHEKQMGGAMGGSSTTPFLVYTGFGKTISEALQKMPTDQHHRLYFAHTKVIILDEDLVSTNGIKSILDFYERNPEIRLNTWLLISPRGQLDKILNTDIGLNIDTGTILEETINNVKGNSFFNVIDTSNVIELLNTSGSELFVSGVNITSKDSHSKSESDDKKFSIQHTAIFKDDKMLGWLNTKEHRGLSWINGTAKGGEITIPIENEVLSLRIVKIKSKVQPEICNEEMQININVDITSNIIESQGGLDFKNKDIIKMIEQVQSEEIKKDITAVINKSRDLQSDFLGFGNDFNKKYPMFWKKIKSDWYSYYSDIKVNIYVNSKIENMGKVNDVLKK
jgi:spore germination protein KC